MFNKTKQNKMNVIIESTKNHKTQYIFFPQQNERIELHRKNVDKLLSIIDNIDIISTIVMRYEEDKDVLLCFLSNGKLIEFIYPIIFDDENDENDENDVYSELIVTDIPVFNYKQDVQAIELIKLYIDTIKICANSLEDFCSGREDSCLVWNYKLSEKIVKFLNNLK